MASIEKLQLTSPMIEEFPSSSGTRRGFLFSHYCSELLSDVLANAAWEWEEIKGIPIWKVEVKLPLFAHNMILHIDNPKETIKKLKTNKQVQPGCRI